MSPWRVHSHFKTNYDIKPVDRAYNRLHNAIRTAHVSRKER